MTENPLRADGNVVLIVTDSGTTDISERTTNMTAGGWTKNATFLLIELYEQFPCLYDVKSPLYFNRRQRQKAILEIAAGVCTVRPNTTARDIKAKINGMRAQFICELNRIKKRQDNPDLAEKDIPPNLWFFSKLSFLHGHIKQRGPKVDREPDVTYLTSEVTTDTTNFDQVFVHEAEEVTYDETESEDIKLDVVENPPKKRSKSRKTSDEDRVTQSTQVCASENNTAVDDHIEKFGQFIISEMKLIKDPRHILEAKRAIQNIIFDIQAKEFEL